MLLYAVAGNTWKPLISRKVHIAPLGKLSVAMILAELESFTASPFRSSVLPASVEGASVVRTSLLLHYGAPADTRTTLRTARRTADGLLEPTGEGDEGGARAR